VPSDRPEITLGQPVQSRLHPLSFLNFAAALAIVLFALTVVSVERANAKSWAYDLAGELMSPFCPGRTLASCPSPQAAELVQWMVLQEAAGATQEEVVANLVDRYGEEILGAPPAKGITLWAYVFPVLGFVVGGGLVVLALRRLVARDSGGRNASASATPSPGSLDQFDSTGFVSLASDNPALADDELARRVDADLAARG